MKVHPNNFEETISNIEVDLDHMHMLYEHLPVPTLLYDKKDNVTWCNKSMLNLFWGVGGKKELRFRAGREYFGKHISELMPQALHEYIAEQNSIVQQSRLSQYEFWQDETIEGTIKWKVLLFPVGQFHIGVVLFPLDEKDLGMCDHALTLRPTPDEENETE